MRSRIVAGVGLVAACAGIVLVLGSSGAAAATPTTFTVTAGTAPAGTDIDWVGPIQNAQRFYDPSTGLTLSCGLQRFSATTRTGPRQSGTAIAAINTNTARCIDGRFEMTGSGVWQLNMGSSTSAASFGSLSKIKATFVDTTAAACRFTVAGSQQISFTNTTSTSRSSVLKLADRMGNLAVSVVSGDCSGVVNTGDLVRFAGSWGAAPLGAGQQPLKIVADA